MPEEIFSPFQFSSSDTRDEAGCRLNNSIEALIKRM